MVIKMRSAICSGWVNVNTVYVTPSNPKRNPQKRIMQSPYRPYDKSSFFSNILYIATRSLVRGIVGRALALLLGAVDELVAVNLGTAVDHAREVNSRVENGEQSRSYEHKGAIEDKERGLILHDFVAPTASHFSHTKNELVSTALSSSHNTASHAATRFKGTRTGKCNESEQTGRQR